MGKQLQILNIANIIGLSIQSLINLYEVYIIWGHYDIDVLVHNADRVWPAKCKYDKKTTVWRENIC